MPTNRQRLLQLTTGGPKLVTRLLHVADSAHNTPQSITSPEDAHTLFVPHLVGHTTEGLVVAALDRKRRPIAVETLTVGNEGFTIVDPSQVYAWARRQGHHGASAILIAHNHPGNALTAQGDQVAPTAAPRTNGVRIALRCCPKPRVIYVGPSVAHMGDIACGVCRRSFLADSVTLRAMP